MPLSALACQNAKPKEKPYKLADFAGLYLWVGPKGSRLWRFDYQIAGKRRTASFGPFPEVTLAEARAKLAEAKKMLREGVDPTLARKTARLRSGGKTGGSFEEVARKGTSTASPDGPTTTRALS